MSDRHQILSDTDFWLKLEYELSDWFPICGDRALGGYWCDGFLPESARNTNAGIEVQGAVWIEEGRKSHDRFEFSLSIPQRLLFRRRNNAVLVVNDIDVQRRRLQLALTAGAHPQKEAG